MRHKLQGGSGFVVVWLPLLFFFSFFLRFWLFFLFLSVFSFFLSFFLFSFSSFSFSPSRSRTLTNWIYFSQLCIHVCVSVCPSSHSLSTCHFFSLPLATNQNLLSHILVSSEVTEDKNKGICKNSGNCSQFYAFLPVPLLRLPTLSCFPLVTSVTLQFLAGSPTGKSERCQNGKQSGREKHCTGEEDSLMKNSPAILISKDLLSIPESNGMCAARNEMRWLQLRARCSSRKMHSCTSYMLLQFQFMLFRYLGLSDLCSFSVQILWALWLRTKDNMHFTGHSAFLCVSNAKKQFDFTTYICCKGLFGVFTTISLSFQTMSALLTIFTPREHWEFSEPCATLSCVVVSILSGVQYMNGKTPASARPPSLSCVQHKQNQSKHKHTGWTNVVIREEANCKKNRLWTWAHATQWGCVVHNTKKQLELKRKLCASISLKK